MLATLVASPVLAFATRFILKMSGWLFYFLPGTGRLWGWGKIVFFRPFSRAVVQQAPIIELPAWHRN